jgi:DNA (cytosine-5)-methyltransferase 1
MLPSAVQTLIPTPRTSDTNGPGHHGTGGPDLRTVAAEVLLQTPSVAGAEGAHERRGGKRSDELLLPGQAKEMRTDWGPYEPAIRRWEAVLGRPAPAPTEPNAKGNHRLSPAFTEWMMGVPEGWITDVNISRNEQLKACGNGVVPQQAAAALKDMLAAFDQEER